VCRQPVSKGLSNRVESAVLEPGLARGVTGNRASGIVRRPERALQAAKQHVGHGAAQRVLGRAGVALGPAAVERRLVVAAYGDVQALVVVVFERPVSDGVGIEARIARVLDRNRLGVDGSLPHAPARAAEQHPMA
jgi:hypothetical protein